MIIEIDVTIAKTINLEVWTANNPNTETSGQRQEPNSDTTAIGREQLCGNTEEILKQNSGESLKSKYSGVKVTKIYYETIMKEMKILASSKPEMSEELREKTAIIVAERICKAFMKENLCLSDLEINELLKELQH
ncbi:hypothetical protein LOD99_9851 [Oopsacas minuta]|uniref:Uncharacterized protein n=1 Tax=Oopsacas minuta TaxID=111878 RepID=A0AAV7KKP4_9METZ|nr:hypothetical protein LOD99_9851 [Oopsacas minuta]